MFENDTLAIAKVRQIFAARLRTPTLCNVSDMGTPTQPEEARIINHAQKTAVPAISMRKAAEMAGISDGRWRQIVKGYQGTGQGRIPVVAPSETVARMALVVGVTDSQLEDAGRPDAAEVLRKLLASSEQPDVELSTVSLDRLLGEIRRRVEGASDAKQHATDHPPASKPGAQGAPSEGEKNVDDINRDELSRRRSSRQALPDERLEDAKSARVRDPEHPPQNPGDDGVGEESQVSDDDGFDPA